MREFAIRGESQTFERLWYGGHRRGGLMRKLQATTYQQYVCVSVGHD